MSTTMLLEDAREEVEMQLQDSIDRLANARAQDCPSIAVIQSAFHEVHDWRKLLRSIDAKLARQQIQRK